MHTDVIRTEEAWETLESEWNQLLNNSIVNVPFLRYEYLRAWWQYRGGGEWPQAELYIITSRGDNGEIIGIAPLFLTENKDGQNALMLLGSIEISDYLDLIVRIEHLDSFVADIVAHLMTDETPDWQVLDWYNLMQASPTLKVLEQAAEEQGAEYHQEVYLPAPYVMLPRTLDDYLSRLDKKYRHEFRRKMRNAAGFFLPVSWHVIDEEEKLDQAMQDFTNLMRLEGHKARFLTEGMAPQMNAIAHALFKSGMLQLAFLKVGNDYAAAYFNIDYNNRIWVYNSGLDRKFEKLSPGIVLAGYLVIDAIEKGREIFDFMRGDEDYKYQFGGQDRFVMRAVVSRN